MLFFSPPFGGVRRSKQPGNAWRVAATAWGIALECFSPQSAKRHSVTQVEFDTIFEGSIEKTQRQIPFRIPLRL